MVLNGPGPLCKVVDLAQVGVPVEAVQVLDIKVETSLEKLLELPVNY